MPLDAVEVTSQLIAFIKHVNAVLDDADQEVSFDYDDAIKADDGYGGRADDGRFAFVFFPSQCDEKWSFALSRDEIRSLAHGHTKAIEVRRAEDVHHRHPGAHTASHPHDKRLGQRLLEALVGQQLVALAVDANRLEIAVALEKILVEALDDQTLDDAERGFEIAEVLGGMHGVEEMLVSDEAIVAIARKLDK